MLVSGMRLRGNMFASVTKFIITGHALHEKNLQRRIGVANIGQQPKTKSGRRPANKPITVSFHISKSRNFKLSVSNPKNKYVVYLSVLSQISNCQSLGRKNKHEILKTDRINRGFCSSIGSLINGSTSCLCKPFHTRHVREKNRSGLLSSMPWRARGTVVSSATRPDIPSYPAPPRRPAVSRPVPTRPLYVRVLDSTPLPCAV